MPAAEISLRLETSVEPRPAGEVSPERPFPLPVNTLLEIAVAGRGPGEGRLRIRVVTREVGMLGFSVRTEPDVQAATRWPRRRDFALLFERPLDARVRVDGGEVIGEVSPGVYGHLVEHLEACVYGVVWDGRGELQPDVAAPARSTRRSCSWPRRSGATAP